MLPGNIVDQLETAIPPLLWQICRMADVRIARAQNRRKGTRLVVENGSRLGQIVRGKADLMNQHRREHVRVVERHGMHSQSVAHCECWEARIAARDIDRM